MFALNTTPAGTALASVPFRGTSEVLSEGRHYSLYCRVRLRSATESVTWINLRQYMPYDSVKSWAAAHPAVWNLAQLNEIGWRSSVFVMARMEGEGKDVGIVFGR